MSGKNEKREQAQKLLRSFTDIDDRFLEEAMQEPEPSAGTGKPSAGRKLRRYSTWALTAAACLTVVIIGRYVTLNRNAELKNEQPVAVSDEIKDTEVPEVSDELNDAGLPEADGVEMNAGPLEAAGEAKSQEEADAVEEADEAAPVEVAGEVYDAYSEEGEAADMESGMMYESAQIANPFTDTKTLEEAQEIAGFEMSVPDAVSPYTVVQYRAIDGEMLEIIFSDKKGEEGYRIRKAEGEDDISGDYNEYAKEKTIRLSDGTAVTLRGDKEDDWSVAVWTADTEDGKSTYSFAVCCGEKTFTTEQIKKMAETMTKN